MPLKKVCFHLSNIQNIRKCPGLSLLTVTKEPQTADAQLSVRTSPQEARLLCQAQAPDDGGARRRWDGCGDLASEIRAGHFRYFLIFSIIIKKMICCIFYQVNLTGNGLFKLDWWRNRLLIWKKMHQNHFLLLKKFKNTSSAQLCKWLMMTG